MLEQFFQNQGSLRASMEQHVPNQRLRALNAFEGAVSLMRADAAGLHPSIQFACFNLFNKLADGSMLLQLGDIPSLMLTRIPSPEGSRRSERIGVGIPDAFLDQLTDTSEGAGHIFGEIAYIAGRSLALLEGVPLGDVLVEKRAQAMRADVLLTVRRYIGDMHLQPQEEQALRDFPDGLANLTDAERGLRSRNVPPANTGLN